MELRDWQSPPTRRYYVVVTRPARIIEGYRFPERFEDHTILAASLVDDDEKSFS